MPLQGNPISVPLVGVQQKADGLGRSPGVLDRAINARFDKHAELGVVIEKRRGYQFVDVSATVNRFDTDAIMTSLAVHGGELVIFTYDYVVGVGDRDAMLRGEDALVYRGPCNRGNCSVRFGAQSPISQQVLDDEEP